MLKCPISRTDPLTEGDETLGAIETFLAKFMHEDQKLWSHCKDLWENYCILYLITILTNEDDTYLQKSLTTVLSQ